MLDHQHTFQALLLDVNGVQVDTGWLLQQSNILAFKEFGYNLTPQDYEDHFIKHATYSLGVIQERRLDINPETFKHRRWSILQTLVKQYGIQPMPGILHLLGEVNTLYSDVLVASVSNNYQREVRLFHDVAGLPRFDLIFTKEMVERPKPYPDIYVQAMRSLHVPASSCIVIENTQKGAVSAYEAGIRRIVVVNSGRTKPEDLPPCTAFVQSLERITCRFFETL